ncbi:nuclease-related domain-containing protein [Desulfitobacterium dichloroeliminans]|uniref:nuclease-related domain-containing protein n=1 Tax=Desulfitobacterium dichloroeliminans TaxID=233055 RepID=UPI0002498F50|nr:nuclease-related domain-containing protein [Desulfitobacterium dichloroeliminans]
MCLKHGDLSAQIDYLIITKKRCFVVEGKSLFGNLQICNGDFIRTVNHKGKYVKEAIYSPITQNKRHLELIKQIRLEQKNFILKALIEKSFYDNYRPVVVLANHKTVLNAKFAKKESRIK